MAHQELSHPPLPDETINEAWKLVDRAVREFMPSSPRPIVHSAEGNEYVAFGLTPAIAPIKGYIETGGSQTITRVDTVENLNNLLRFGVSAQSGTRTILHTSQFPGRRIYNFLKRTDAGFVMQLYEEVVGRDHAEFPIALHEVELRTIAPFFARINIARPNLSSVISFGRAAVNFKPPQKP